MLLSPGGVKAPRKAPQRRETKGIACLPSALTATCMPHHKVTKAFDLPCISWHVTPLDTVGHDGRHIDRIRLD